MPSIDIPEGYQYVLATAASTIWLNIFQYGKVMKARRKAGIEYPQMYADASVVTSSPMNAAYLFNCTQRAHQNTLEALPFLLLNLGTSGLKYPYAAAGLGAAWIVGRVSYTVVYSAGYPEKRYKGLPLLNLIGYMGLTFLSTYTVGRLVIESF